jgi:hypothetical protein
VEAEPGAGNPRGNFALARIEIGASEVALNRRTALGRQLSVADEPAEQEREVTLLDPAAFGMEFLECLRELVTELLDRPVGDRPAHPVLVARLPLQPLLFKPAAVLVLAAAAAGAGSVPGRLRHEPNRRSGSGRPRRAPADRLVTVLDQHSHVRERP